MSKLFSGTQGALQINTADIAANAIDGTLTKDALIADYSDVTITASDLIMYGDATDSNNTKRDTVQGILDLAGGVWAVIESTNASGAAEIDFDSGITSTYAAYKIICSKIELNTDTASLILRINDDTTSGVYEYHLIKSTRTNTSYGAAESGTSSTSIKLANSCGTGTGENVSCEVTIYDPADTSHYKNITSIGANYGSSGLSEMSFLGGTWRSTSAATSIQIKADSGTISGQATLYGLKHS